MGLFQLFFGRDTSETKGQTVREMNGQPLPIVHEAPLRLCVETRLRFTMVKYIRAIEFIEDYKSIGHGQGAWQEDYRYFSHQAVV
jgi:hypothetical protein